MRLTILLFLAASPAAAHPGHLAEVAGHGHWIGAAAIGLAAAIALWGALKGEKAEPESKPEDAPEEDAEAEPA